MTGIEASYKYSVMILQSPFFDVDPEVDHTVEEYTARILDTVVLAVEDQLGTVEWRLAAVDVLLAKDRAPRYCLCLAYDSEGNILGKHKSSNNGNYRHLCITNNQRKARTKDAEEDVLIVLPGSDNGLSLSPSSPYPPFLTLFLFQVETLVI
ncbi:hypothetical protein M5K25_021546 [Dendrobium thyrsiflorum]|uniref:Uncharacterized protein n=1 Tax=Dendrobium thyrsiflorum TaxID=117978 RepID=A0ABD0UJM1_DENTH